MYIGLCVKNSLFLSDFNETSNFSTYFRKTLKYQISIRPGGAEVFQAHRRTDRHGEANSCFSQFYEGVKNISNLFHVCLSDKLDDLCF